MIFLGAILLYFGIALLIFACFWGIFWGATRYIWALLRHIFHPFIF